MKKKKVVRFRYYPASCEYIACRISTRFGTELDVRRVDLGKLDRYDTESAMRTVAGHVLWMMQKLQELDKPAKRGRWMGWIYATCEWFLAGIQFTNRDSRRLARQDSHAGKV